MYIDGYGDWIFNTIKLKEKDRVPSKSVSLANSKYIERSTTIFNIKMIKRFFCIVSQPLCSPCFIRQSEHTHAVYALLTIL